jgi:hypothetical protein
MYMLYDSTHSGVEKHKGYGMPDKSCQHMAVHI